MGNINIKKLRETINRIEFQMDDPSNKDDPRWLQRWKQRVIRGVIIKEKAIEHKGNQKKEY